MIHYKYEFTDRADMLKDLKSYYTTNEEGEDYFNAGHIVELGFQYSYNEETEESTKTSDYLVDILWTIDPPMRLSKEVYPETPNHYFSGLEEEWTKTKEKKDKDK